MTIQKIISGGQTGVDRAALDVALELGIPCGGWCPKGRRAEDGVIDEKYPLDETDSRDYAVRTERNVVKSDGTLVLYQDRLQGGTALTIEFAKEHGKPHRKVVLEKPKDLAEVWKWIADHQIEVLNVAGPRNDPDNEIYESARALLSELLSNNTT